MEAMPSFELELHEDGECGEEGESVGGAAEADRTPAKGLRGPGVLLFGAELAALELDDDLAARADVRVLRWLERRALRDAILPAQLLGPRHVPRRRRARGHVRVRARLRRRGL